MHRIEIMQNFINAELRMQNWKRIGTRNYKLTFKWFWDIINIIKGTAE